MNTSYLEYIIAAIGISILLLHLLIRLLTFKETLPYDIKTELEKKIKELNLSTKVIIENNSKSYYCENEITIGRKNTFQLFCSAFHELGHAYYDKYSSYVHYSKNGDSKRILDIKQESKKTNLYFCNSAILFLGISILSVLISSSLSVLLSVFSMLLVLPTITEECTASISAMNIIRVSKYFNKLQEIKCCFYLISLLGTYLFIFLVPFAILIYDILII